MPLIRQLSVTPIYHMLVCNGARIYMGFFVRIYMRVCTHKAEKNASIRGKKTHVYRVSGMIASKRGKIPHVYRVIILKQMADHIFQPNLKYLHVIITTLLRVVV